jgi:hypothetical protein
MTQPWAQWIRTPGALKLPIAHPHSSKLQQGFQASKHNSMVGAAGSGGMQQGRLPRVMPVEAAGPGENMPPHCQAWLQVP